MEQYDGDQGNYDKISGHRVRPMVGGPAWRIMGCCHLLQEDERETHLSKI